MDSEDESFDNSGDADYSSNMSDAAAEDIDDTSADTEADCAAVSPVQKPYKILTEDDIQQLLDKDVSTVADVLSISKVAACTLLCRNKWNLTSVHDQFFAADKNPQFSAAAELGQLACNICSDELTYQNTVAAACGHPFCADCWKTYVAKAIADGSGCLTLTCPEPGCSAAAGVDLVESLASAGDIDKYHRYLRRSFVECSQRMKLCPAAGCNFSIEFDGAAAVEFDVTCNCSHKFCWNCTAEHHRPVSCETVARWTEKNNSEAESTNWILAYTKPCPKCGRPIEKNLGGNSITCSSPCLFRFCWVCCQPWSIHTCNNYSKIFDVKREKAKMYSLRYTHYYERWHANEQSEKVAMADLRRWRDGDMAKLGESEGGELQMKILVEALEQIVECRRVLKWSYAYGYYMEGESSEKVAFFEYLQGEAEAGLEEMMKYVDICKEDFKEFRDKLARLTMVTKNYFQNLVEELENNLAQVVSRRSDDDQKSLSNLCC